MIELPDMRALKSMSGKPMATFSFDDLSSIAGESYRRTALAELERLEAKDSRLRQYPKYQHFLSNLHELAGDADKATMLAEHAYHLSDSQFHAKALAKSLTKARRVDDSRRLFDEIVNKEPDTEAYLGLAQLCLLEGDLEGAERYADLSLELDNSDCATLMLKGVLSIQRGDWRLAIRYFRGVLRANVFFAPAHAYMSICYWVLSDSRRAFSEILQSVELDPLNRRWINILYDMGILLGQPQKVIDQMQRYLTYIDDDPRMWSQLARSAYCSWKNSGERRYLGIAKGSLEREIRLAPSLSSLNNMGVIEHLQGRPLVAYNCYKKAIESYPNAGTELPLANVIGLFISQGRLEQAEDLCKANLSKLETTKDAEISARIWLQYSFLLQKKGQYEQAISVALRVLGLDVSLERRMDAGNHLLFMYSISDRHSSEQHALIGEMSDLLNSAMHSGLDCKAIQNNLAFTCLQVGERHMAEEFLRELTDEIGRDPYVTATFGLLKLWSGSLSTGKSYYQRAISLASSRELKDQVRQRMALEVGDALLARGDDAGALREYKRGRKLKRAIKLVKDQLDHRVAQIAKIRRS